MNPRHRYSLHLYDNPDLTVDAGRTERGGWVLLGPIVINTHDMAALADTLERASRLARSVAADQLYEQGEAES